MKLSIILTGIAVILLISSFLKLCYVIHIRKEKKQYKESLATFDLLDEDISYSKYKKISRRASVPNKPIRLTGDFLDFLISSDNTSGIDFVENTLSKANCGNFLNE